ncbi:RHS repeat domain-containing protein [Chryseobacterium indologenes]|uniref:RHS repeat domain-containing protein n=1 Tax=Chryseobacterium indologenes TaxID=253 RepID=UPI0026B159FE|nr:RHS repeat-associated core domain-containing protein [Chryseobacterium indologenes]
MLRNYSYQYDALNRLTEGRLWDAMNLDRGEYTESLTYDLNGNIGTLKRKGRQFPGYTAPENMDDLAYVYSGNRLTKVDDLSLNPSGYPIGGKAFGYDGNGNMTVQEDKGLSIAYNYLNLPQNILSPQGITAYVYSADGTKVKKTAGSKVVDYQTGFQYENSTLQFFPTSEGYFDVVKNKYIYNYTDHLGNVRLSYMNSGSGLEIIEESNYYPFGLKHEGYNTSVGNAAYQYKYNGKELQETGMYDYGARMYMPDLGRWGVVDPLAETSRRWSPYTYAFNNPIRFIDPDGRSGKDWYQNNLIQNIEWHDGSAELDGYTNLTAINNTRVLGVENGQTVQEFNLNSDGSFTADGQLFNNGDSATTLIGTTITSKPGFDLTKWLSHLGNEGGDFYSNLGGSGPREDTNPFFRGDIDKMVDMGGYFGGIYNGLSRGDQGISLMNTMVDVMSLIDLAVSAAGSTKSSSNAVAAEPDTLSYHGSQAVGLNIYRGSGNRITGVGVKTQDVHKTNMSRSQKDSMVGSVNAINARLDKQADSILKRITPR